MTPHERQDQVLDAVRRVAAPLARLLMDHGIGYQSFVAQMKPVFLEQTLAQIQERGEKVTDSAISLRSGVHRKDISAWRANPGPRAEVKRSIPAEVFARWVSDRRYRGRDGEPRHLPRTGGAPSFETLARSVNQDVHPLTVLNELIRLGLARLEEEDGAEVVCLTRTGFVPQRDWGELLDLFAENIGAHLATAAQNLRGEAAPQLEQAVYAGGLTQPSAEELAQLSRTLWAAMMDQFLAEATRLYEQDGGKGEHLVRLGAYFNDRLLPPEEGAE